MKEITLTATCIFGVESILAREIRDLGYPEVETKDGRVSFSCNYSDIPKANIRLRVAEQVLLKVAEFPAETFDELYDRIKGIDWDMYLSKEASFPVDVTSINSRLFGISACQSIVKKAIVDKLRSKYKMEVFPESGPCYKVSVALLNNLAAVYIDTSGVGLHKRGYRTLTGAAPLKETLAAAMIMISRWKKDRVLLDPLCGTGTIPIEAALIGKNIAPGLGRSFVSEGWLQIAEKDWVHAREEARDLIDRSVKLNIQGTDIDDKTWTWQGIIRGWRTEGYSFPKRRREISSSKQYRFIMQSSRRKDRDKRRWKKLYEDMGKPRNSRRGPNILTPHRNLRGFGKKADKEESCTTAISCTYYQYFEQSPRNDKISRRKIKS